MKKILFSIWHYRLIRLALAIIFLWSGWVKLSDIISFAITIEAFGLVPEIFVEPMAVAIPVVEIILAIGLLLDIRWSLTATTGLLLIFMLVLAYGIFMGLDIDCGCFGAETSEDEVVNSLRTAFLRDIGMMAAIVYLYLYRYRQAGKIVKLRQLL